MPSCPAGGTTPSQYLKFFLGPFDYREVGSISRIDFRSGRCTGRTLTGRPYRSEAGFERGTSVVSFTDLNLGIGGMRLYRRGEFIIMDDFLWEILDVYSDTTVLLRDLRGYWPLRSRSGEIQRTEFFLDLLPERGNTPTGLQLDGYTYTWALTDRGQRPEGGQRPMSELIGSERALSSASEVFYIFIIATAPSEFQGFVASEYNGTVESYNIGQRISTRPRSREVIAPYVPPVIVEETAEIIATGEDSASAVVVDTSTSSDTSSSSSTSACVGLGCSDPFGALGAADIEPTCDSLTLFNPYAQNKSGNLYKQLNNIVSDIFGHTVNYFRTTADVRTKDVTLMEYSLHNVAAKDDIKILVPDNEFPEEAATFDIFGMEFAEFEVHIVHEKFKAIFGSGVRPRARDYMYIPITNKMYEVNSVSIADEFNATRSYWRLKLTKYQDRSSVIKGAYETATDDLITGIEEVFGEEIKDEQTKDSNPVQFQTITRVLEDGSRTYIDSGLTIVDEAIVNNFQTVSHNHYDLSKVATGVNALKYATASNMPINGQIAVTAWFRPTFEITDTVGYHLISDNISQGGFDVKISTLKISVIINGVVNDFTHNTSLSKTKWYGIAVNIMNNSENIQVMLYSLSVTGHVSSMVQEFTQTKDMVGGQQYWTNTSPYILKGGKLNITCLRIFDKAIETTEMQNILNQYVVRDNQHALVIDNAIPSLGYQKFKNAR